MRFLKRQRSSPFKDWALIVAGVLLAGLVALRAAAEIKKDWLQAFGPDPRTQFSFQCPPCPCPCPNISVTLKPETDL